MPANRESNSTEAEVVAELRGVLVCPSAQRDIMNRAAALIESQRATIERVERERDEAREQSKAHKADSDFRLTELATAEARVTALEAEKAELRTALEKVERWFGEFPETGEFWDKENTQPMSYGACFGSNGERDFMREIARQALAQPSTQENDNGR